MTRLTPAALAARGIRLPFRPEEVTIGVVHLGIGAFARAHTIAYTEDAMVAGGELRWGVSAVTQRSDTVSRQLRPQDGLYTLTERDAGMSRVRVIGAIREVLSGPHEPEKVVARLAAPSTAVVTLTVTEKGYRLHPDTGRLDLADPQTRAEVSGAAPTTPVGQLARALQMRHRSGAGPITIVSCDNLPSNGALTRGAVLDFIGAMTDADDGLADWVAREIAFPSTMVDRMVPQTSAGQLDEVEAELGLRDEAAVIAEPFRQWVVEDRFAAGRPAWEAVGVMLTPDVSAWEAAKLRLLNASHSLLAYLGLSAGLPTVAETAAIPAFRRAAERLMTDEAAPSLTLPAGLDVPAYIASVIGRFQNPVLGHTTAKVGADGSLKLPLRVLPTARECLKGGREPRWAALTVAAWMHHVAHSSQVDDPAAEQLAAALPQDRESRAVIPALLSVRSVFDPALAADPRFVDLLGSWYPLLGDPDSLRKEIIR